MAKDQDFGPDFFAFYQKDMDDPEIHQEIARQAQNRQRDAMMSTGYDILQKAPDLVYEFNRDLSDGNGPAKNLFCRMLYEGGLAGGLPTRETIHESFSWVAAAAETFGMRVEKTDRHIILHPRP